MTGLECVAIVDVDGIEARVVGHYGEHTLPGAFDSYDIYVRNEISSVFELIDLGQPFQECPSDDEVGVIITQLFNPSAVKVLSNA